MTTKTEYSYCEFCFQDFIIVPWSSLNACQKCVNQAIEDLEKLDEIVEQYNENYNNE